MTITVVEVPSMYTVNLTDSYINRASLAVTIDSGVLINPVEVTLSDGGRGGIFTPASVVLTDTQRSHNVEYTASTDGLIEISSSNDGNFPDPESVIFTSVMPINITAYGAVGNGSVNDASAFKSAAIAAMAAGRPLYIPQGTYRLVVPTGQTNHPSTLSPGPGTWIILNNPLSIAGDGNDTILVIEPSDPVTGNMFVFMIPHNVNNIGIIFDHIRIDGPARATDVEFDSQPQRYLVMHYGPYLDNLHTWSKAYNTKITGEFLACFQVDAAMATPNASVTWDFANCEMEALSGALLCFSNSNAPATRTLTCRDCTFDAGIPGPTEGSIGRGNALYIHPSTNLLVERCTFVDNHRCALKYAGVSASGNANYGIIRDCIFDTCTNTAIETDEYTHTIIEECYFSPTVQTAIVHFGHFTMRNCTGSPKSIASTSGLYTDNVVVTIEDCNYNNITSVITGMPIGWTNSNYVIRRCNFLISPVVTPGLPTLLFQCAVKNDSILIEDCTIEGQNTSSIAISMSYGNWTVKNNIFTGTFKNSQGGVVTLYNKAGATCYFDGNTFNQTTGSVLAIISSLSDGKITGRNNILGSGVDLAYKYPGAVYGIQDWRDLNGNVVDLNLA